LNKYIDENKEHKEKLSTFNKEFDRYKDILPYYFEKKNEKDNENNIKIHNDKYINASYISILDKEKYFIITQAPKENTIDDFWTLVSEYNCNVIVMLCNFEENGKKKCSNYFDETKIKLFNLKIIEEVQQNMYIVKKIEISYNDKENKTVKREITHIHFTQWPDKGVPDGNDETIFEAFLEIINKVNDLKKEGPILVHCSAGVGRTGTFISMFSLYKEILAQKDQKDKDIIQFNIFNLVRKMKEMRIYMVQTNLQYIYIHQFVRYLLNKENNK